MSLKKNKSFLYTSSLVALASLSLCTVTSISYAGFEWTPPPESVRPAPQKMPPVPADPIDEQTALDPDDPQSIMDSLPSAKSNALPPVIDKTKEEPPKLKVKVLTPKKDMPAPAEAKIQTPTPIVEAAQEEPKSKTVKVDLFPMSEDGVDDMAPSGLTPVVLPSDPEKNLDDINAEDVVTAAGEKDMSGEKISWNAPETFDVIEGFGSEMPLVIALQQIVPPNYAYTIGKGVNPGQKVSWEGGKPWNEVLTSTLHPIGIKFSIARGNRLVLNKMANLPVMTDTPPAVEVETEVTPMPEEHAEVPAEPVIEKIAIDTPKQKVLEETAHHMATEEPTKIPTKVSRNVILDPGKKETAQDEIIRQVMGENGPEPKKITIKKKQETPLEEPLEGLAQDAAKAEDVLLAKAEPMPLPEEIAPAMETPEEKPYIEEIVFNPPPERNIEPAAPAQDRLTLAKVNADLRVWKADSGNNVKRLLEKWSKELGVTLDWQGDDKVKLKQNVLINGTFKNALKILFDQDTVKSMDYDLVESDSGVILSVKSGS